MKFDYNKNSQSELENKGKPGFSTSRFVCTFMTRFSLCTAGVVRSPIFIVYVVPFTRMRSPVARSTKLMCVGSNCNGTLVTYSDGPTAKIVLANRMCDVRFQ